MVVINAYQLKQVSFSYDKVEALSIEKLNIRANKITALIGANGSGKSTLLNLLSFLKNTQQGELQFFSEPFTKKQQHRFIQRISFLSQKPYMLRGSVADNLNLALKFHQQNNKREEQIEEALVQLGIAHLRLKQAKSLSGGEQQKVALARAIITNPEVLLMDEPFSYLDHHSESLLEDFILKYVKNHKKTLIFSTHNRLQGIAIADDVISLVHGKVANSPLINLFQGTVKNQIFDTGKIKILLKVNDKDYQHISIDPHEIILSVTAMVSNLQNQYQGRVTAIIAEGGKIRISILAGELFQVMLSIQAFNEMKVSLDDLLWVSFQANSVHIF